MRFVFPLSLLLSAPLAAAPVEIAQLPAKVVPEQIATLNMEAGMLSDWADASQRLERGAVLGILNRERTEQEREEMELAIAKEELNIRDEIRKLQAQRRKVQFYLSLSDKEKSYAGEMLGGEAPPTAESLRDIDERLGLQRRLLETLPRTKRNEFKRGHDKLTLHMPFSGRVQYTCSLPDDPEKKPFEFVLAPGQHFATVCDDSAFYITINLSRAEMTQLPPEQLSVAVSLPEGKQLRGLYDHRLVEHSSGDMLVYFFRLPQEESETAFSMLGSNARAKLFYDGGEGTRSVSKMALLSRPEAADCADWEELVGKVYPDCDIVVIGERDIILRPRP